MICDRPEDFHEKFFEERKSSGDSWPQAKAPVGTTRNRCSGSTGRQITGIFSQKMQSVGTVSGLKEVLQRRAL
jgi:hypothetical protein